MPASLLGEVLAKLVGKVWKPSPSSKFWSTTRQYDSCRDLQSAAPSFDLIEIYHIW